MRDEERSKAVLSRREFVRRVGAATLAGGAGLSFPLACVRSPSLLEPPVRAPLRFPPVLRPEGETLLAAPAAIDVGGARSAAVWAYNGVVPGPTIRARSGESIRVHLQNALPQDTTIHWHGLIVPHDMDGSPHRAVPGGSGTDYHFPVVQRAGTYWYHPHPHMHTGEQVARGLAGFLLVTDDEEAALHLPSGEYELPLLIRDATMGDEGDLHYRRARGGTRGDFPIVNGVAYPTHDVGTAIYRLRVLNGSNARVFRLAMTGGMSFTLIGSDGGLLDTPSTLTEIVLAPAERVDLLVDFRDSPVGQRAALTCRDAGWDLLTFVVTHRASVPGTIPTATTRLSTIAPLADAPSEPTRSFRFGRHHEINGREYDAGRVDFRVQRGRTERWRFEAGNGTPHPVHVHGATFQVQSRQGGRGQLFSWERGWKDTVLLSDDEVVEVLIRFDKYAGTYLLHCHKLEHEDGGMMLNFAVD